MRELDTDAETSIIEIQEFISKNMRNKIYNNRIRQIADKSNLTKYIPSRLNQWGDDDYTYDRDVYSLLRDSYINADSITLENFFDDLYDNIKLFLCCRRFQKDKCDIPKKDDWDDLVCESCENFLDNGLRDIFVKHLRVLGFTVDEDDFVHYEGKDTLDIEQLVTEITRETSAKIVEELLPEDIISKGKEMAEFYIFLYCIENSLRLFLDNYIDSINIPTSIKRKIEERKNDEKLNKWLPIRGGSDLFYTDLDELGNIIQNNWGIFSNCFPDQNWIIGKIQEIYELRNRIAHTAYLKKDDRDLLRVYYKQIMKQIQTSKESSSDT